MSQKLTIDSAPPPAAPKLLLISSGIAFCPGLSSPLSREADDYGGNDKPLFSLDLKPYCLVAVPVTFLGDGASKFFAAGLGT